MQQQVETFVRLSYPTIREWRACSSSPRTVAKLIAFLRDPLKFEYEVTEPCVVEGSIWGDDEITDGLHFPILVKSFMKVGALSTSLFRNETGEKIPDLIRVNAGGWRNYYLLFTGQEKVHLLIGESSAL